MENKPVREKDEQKESLLKRLVGTFGDFFSSEKYASLGEEYMPLKIKRELYITTNKGII